MIPRQELLRLGVLSLRLLHRRQQRHRPQVMVLVDPVEDDPKHKWSEFEEWYIQCVTAMLMFTDVTPTR